MSNVDPTGRFNSIYGHLSPETPRYLRVLQERAFLQIKWNNSRGTPDFYSEILHDFDKEFNLWNSLKTLALAGGARTITSDRIVYNNSSLSFPFKLVGMISLGRNYWQVINLLFALPGLYLNILKTEKILQFLGRKILNVCDTSFQRKRAPWAALNKQRFFDIRDYYSHVRGSRLWLFTNRVYSGCNCLDHGLLSLP